MSTMGASKFPQWEIKIVGTTILLFLCMFFGCIPLKLQRSDGMQSSRRDLFISLANCFAGGVFFNTVMLDMLPEVEENMQEALTFAKIETDFPLGHFLVAIGFLFMLVLEQVIHSFCHNSIVDHHGHENYTIIPSNESDTENEDAGNLIGNGNIERFNNTPDSNGDVYYAPKQRGRSHSIVSGQPSPPSNFRVYMLVFAISLHSIFEGLAAGLIEKASELYQVYIALLIHKSIIAFSIGMQLLDARLQRKVSILCMGIFSSMTPIGVVLGLLVLGSFDTGVKLFMSGILSAIATGTFLFVTFFEVLPHELGGDDGNKAWKILSVVIGCVMVTGICTYESGGFHRAEKIGNKTLPVGFDF